MRPGTELTTLPLSSGHFRTRLSVRN